MTRYTEVLPAIYNFAKSISIHIEDTSELDPYFKGDLDGTKIMIASALEDEEELFNILHLIGHTVQWNVSEELRALGSIFYEKPSDELLKKLQVYEWEANCYALWVLNQLEIFDLDEWLQKMYREDMYYLTHYYKTGEKLKEITDIGIAYEFTWPLIPLKIPHFVPYANTESRNGIVVDFTNAIKK